MIDKENEVFTRVAEAVAAEFPDANIDSSYQPVPSGFPHVSLYQYDSYTPRELQDNRLLPKYEAIYFEAQVYSNKTEGRKQECKKIMEIICDTMSRMNLRRTILTPVPNQNDSSIYRMTARFEGVASEDAFYRR